MATSGPPTTVQTNLFACITSAAMRSEREDICEGVSLERVYVDAFGHTMTAYAPPPSAKAHHPSPWVPVLASTKFDCRVQIRVSSGKAQDEAAALNTAWLAATVLRCRLGAPIRIPFYSPVSFNELPTTSPAPQITPFEMGETHIGAFTTRVCDLEKEGIQWLKEMLPSATHLFSDLRFRRFLTLSDTAQWAHSPEAGCIMVWTALEVFFDLSDKQDKTKAISRCLSKYLASERSEYDKIFPLVRKQYQHRGSAVHAGASLENSDVAQTFRLANVVLQQCLIQRELPAT